MSANLFGLIVLLMIGFYFMIRGAHYLIEGASSLARKLSISEIAIGLTVISFGTSAPELSVNVLAALTGDAEIAFGNIIGSNQMNLLLVLGLSALVYPLTVNESTVWKEIPFSILAIFIFMILVNDVVINKLGQNQLTRSDGVVLLLFFILFLVYVYKLPRSEAGESPEIKVYSGLKTILMLLIGIVGLGFGGKLVVENSVEIALLLGISHKLIGLTLVAGGTSLPELVTSLMAAFRKKMDLAVGNVIGSNIFNILFILGISALISPLKYDAALNFDVGILTLCSAFLFVAIWLRRRAKIERWIGVLFLMIYGGYIYYLIIRH
jgi:cation:H+ antiporter